MTPAKTALKPLALLLLVLCSTLGLGACAAMQKASYDGEKPTKVCPATLEGGESKTFCY